VEQEADKQDRKEGEKQVDHRDEVASRKHFLAFDYEGYHQYGLSKYYIK